MLLLLDGVVVNVVGVGSFFVVIIIVVVGSFFVIIIVVVGSFVVGGFVVIVGDGAGNDGACVKQIILH